MDRRQPQADTVSSAPGSVPDLQEPLRTCTGTCAQCSDAAKELPDITGKPDLVRLVDSFYEKVRADPQLGHVFDTAAEVHWETHLPKLYDFWDSVLFRAGTYRGNPIAVHANLLPLTDMGWPLFERWLELFRLTVEQHFSGERAGHIVRSAEDMAGVIYSRIHGTTNPRHHPVLLSPEHQARYASYQNLPADD